MPDLHALRAAPLGGRGLDPGAAPRAPPARVRPLTPADKRWMRAVLADRAYVLVLVALLIGPVMAVRGLRWLIRICTPPPRPAPIAPPSPPRWLLWLARQCNRPIAVQIARGAGEVILLALGGLLSLAVFDAVRFAAAGVTTLVFAAQNALPP